jgi:uncharacterized repeat protein (TIGR01451 family)
MKNKVSVERFKYQLMTAGLFLALTAQSGFVNAEQIAGAANKQEALKVTLTASKVQKDAKGKEVFLKADKVKPGEVIEYRASYANVSQANLSGVMATLPVPKGMVYIDKTANPMAVMATVDNVKFEPVPLKRQVKDKSGKEMSQVVPIAEYRALRWSLGDIQVGKVLTVSARMSVEK